MFSGFISSCKSLCLIQCHVLEAFCSVFVIIKKRNKLLDILSMLSSAQGIFWNQDDIIRLSTRRSESVTQSGQRG